MHDDKTVELNPEIHADRWEALVSRINDEAGPLLAARRRRASLGGVLSAWTRPVMTASIGLAAAALLAVVLIPEPVDAEDGAALAEAVVPWSVAAWMDGEYSPTVEELIWAVEDYTP